MSAGEPKPFLAPPAHSSVTLSTTMSSGSSTPNWVSASAHGWLAAPRRTVLALIFSADHSRSADSRAPGRRWPGRAAVISTPSVFPLRAGPGTRPDNSAAAAGSSLPGRRRPCSRRAPGRLSPQPEPLGGDRGVVPQPLDFGSEPFAARRGEPVVTAQPAVDHLFPVSLDQAFRDDPVQCRVQRAGTQLDPATGHALNLGHDPVAMLRAFRQRR